MSDEGTLQTRRLAQLATRRFLMKLGCLGLREHQPFNLLRPTGGFVAIDYHGAQSHIAGSRLEAHRHAVQKLADNQFLFDADDSIVGSAHAYVGDVRSAFRENSLVCSWNVGMRAHDSCYPPVEIPAHRDFLGCGFCMQVHQDDPGFNLLQKLVGNAEWVVVGGHEHTPLKIDYGVGNFALHALIHSRSRHIRRVVRRPQNASRGAVAVAFYHLEVIDDLAFVPDVVACGNDIDIKFEQLLSQGRRNPKPRRGVFSIGDNQIDAALAYDAGQAVFDYGSPGPPKDVADEEYPHKYSRNLMVTRGRETIFRARSSGLGRDDLGGSQKIVISCWSQFDSLHALGVHQDVVEIPEIDVRQLLSKNLLHFCVERLSDAGIDLAARL